MGQQILTVQTYTSGTTAVLDLGIYDTGAAVISFFDVGISTGLAAGLATLACRRRHRRAPVRQTVRPPS